MRQRINFVDIIILVVVALLTFLCLIPILNTIAVSFSDKTSAALGQVYFWPVNFNTTAYQELVKDWTFFRAFLVSVERVLLGTSISVGLSILMAYPISKSTYVFPQRNIYMWIFLFTMMFGGGLIPTFLVYRSLGLLDTMWVLVLPGAVNVWNTIILMNFYKGIPPSLEESAMMDGAKPLTILLRIFVPLSKASIATITLFTAVGHWNSFFDGKLFITSLEKIPLQTYIQSLAVNLSSADMLYLDPDEIIRRLQLSSTTFNAAKVIVSMVPIIAIYPYLQKHFTKGIVLGAVKE